MRPATLFRAFVSYCHADVTFAARLQRQLEGYRLPRRLAGRVAPNPGQAPGRIGPVFRDRADLSAAEDLSAAVREAIAASSALVVVASPDAARSHWVAREIALFRAHHPSAPVLVALARGEPSEALPDALKANGIEPLAADFRKQGDGKRLAFLKIVAGLADLPLDTLVQRDAQRQLRRVTAVTVGTAGLVVVMALLLVTALRAREEAERRRADAEGLVEYMLTDLRERLNEVGRFDVLEAVNVRALTYYAAQGDLKRLPDESLERRARVLHAMGADYEKRDRLAEALAKFEEAHRATAAILARNPNDAKAIFAHGQSEYWIGRISERRQDWNKALARYQAYNAAAQRLIALEPTNVDYMMESGWGEINLGVVELQSGRDVLLARRRIRAALEWFEKADHARPGDSAIRDEIGNAYAWIADSYNVVKDYGHSLEWRRREWALKEEIAGEDRNNNAARFQAAKARMAVAVNLSALGRAAEARPLFKAAELDMVALLRIEPNNREWRVVAQRVQKAIPKGRAE